MTHLYVDFNVQKDDDWFMTGLKATNTQNIPVFFYAINNEKLDTRLINQYYELDSGL